MSSSSDTSEIVLLKVTSSSKRAKISLECASCHNIPMSPIKECEKGHIVCGPCVESKKTCTCATSDEGSTSDIQVLPVLVPSHFAERIVREYKFPCQYKNYGCSDKLISNDLKTHLLSCRYRPVGCFETVEITKKCCNGKMYSSNSFHLHLEFVHNIGKLADGVDIVEYRNMDDFNTGYNRGIFFTKRFDGKVFFGHTLCRNNYVHFWISVIGNESVAAKYKYEWILKNPKADPSLNSTEGDYSWKISVVPIYKYRFDDALSLGRVATYNCKQLVHLYCTEQVEPKSSKIFKASWRQTIEICKV